MTNKIRNFIAADDEKVEKLIEEYPIGLTTNAIAEFLSIDVASVRAILENGVVGLAWKQSCKSRHGYYIPTAQFVRWYIHSR